MKKKTNTLHLLHRRKFFLVLPLLVLPFTTLLFWALGGGKGSEAAAGQSAASGGLNMQLPDAHLKEDASLTKLSFYEKAASDSARLAEQLKSDPYYRLNGGTVPAEMMSPDTTVSAISRRGVVGGNSKLNASPYNGSGYSDPNEEKVYRKLGELDSALSKSAARPERVRDEPYGQHRTGTSVSSADIDRLEQMMNRSRSGGEGDDPEMQQLNAVMEKILDIQHPERVKERVKHPTEMDRRQVFGVSVGDVGEGSSLLERSGSPSTVGIFNRSGGSTNGFFSLEEEEGKSTEPTNAIQAVVHETQTVTDGAVVKLRLISDITINHQVVPRGSFVFGVALLNGERLTIKINSIRYKNSLLPVQLSVVDMDGLDGIYAPGTLTGEVAQNTADRAIQGIGMNTLDPSLGAKAAGAGIEAARTLLSRKTKQVKITLKAGYQVLLRDDKQ